MNKWWMALAVIGLGARCAAAPVVLNGTVGDETTRLAVLARLHGLYGDAGVEDQVRVRRVSAGAGWAQAVQRLIVPELKLVAHGQLRIDGRTVAIEGEVAGSEQHRRVRAALTAALDGSFTLRDRLREGAPEQQLLDQTLAGRTVEFDSGAATLTATGRRLLDQMAAALRQVGTRRVQVIGHTDNAGARNANLALSLARAEAVRSYLAAQGIEAGRIAVAGAGPDRPVADNASPAGRARNRRIEFQVLP